MTRLVVLPHGDPTIAVGGDEALDVERTFCGHTVARLGLAGGSALAPRDALALAAARSLLGRTGTSVHARLRAVGALLAARSAGTAVHLRVDDVELAQGTTEKTADLAAAAEGAAPWAEELATAAEALGGEDVVRLWIDRDQTLIAAATLAARLPARVAIELAGPFADKHATALATIPAFARARFVRDAAAPTWTIAGFPGVTDGDGPGVEWRRHLPRPPAGARAWAGTIHAEELKTPDALLASGCKVAAVAFATWDADGLLARSGDRYAAADMIAAARTLADGGCALVGELWLGAPGIGEAAVDATLAYLEAERPCAWMAGFRGYSWDVAEAPRAWDGRVISVGEPEPGRDLARTRPFTAEGTITAARLGAIAPALLAKLAKLGGPVAGNCGQAIATRPPAPPTTPRLDEDCAIVELAVGLDGKPGPAWTATNLRTGTTLALDARLAPRLAALAKGGSVDEALAPVPAEKRAGFAKALASKGVLAGVGA